MNVEFDFNECFPEVSYFALFITDLDKLMKAVTDLRECAEAYENHTDFIWKAVLFVHHNKHALKYMESIVEELEKKKKEIKDDSEGI